ncbi:unnamed protein product [Ectocarpus sp. 8 AP-2014]
MVVLYDRAWLQDLRLHPLVLLLFVQINQAAGEYLFQYVVRSLSAFEQTVFEKAREKSATRRHRSSDGLREEDRGGASPHGNAAPKAEEVSDAMVTGFKDGLIDFEHLKEAVDWNLVFKRAANGDADGALERLGYCVEVCIRAVPWGVSLHVSVVSPCARCRGSPSSDWWFQSSRTAQPVAGGLQSVAPHCLSASATCGGVAGAVCILR